MITHTLPPDYAERVYAGVLGKMIGVYLGRPFEQWTHERIMRELGEIWYYVHDKVGKPLIVTDDDLTGTFTFLRALEDYGNSRDVTAAQIGQSWLNYIIEGKTILWWGGLGYSTEHTAYLRLKRGVSAPESGSFAQNDLILAEQIGAQIFIDGWGMVAAGDPALAAELAKRAGSVSHDGEAVYAAQLWAAMEAAAFTEPDIDRLLDIGLSFIPAASIISRLIGDLRELRQREGDWRTARAWLDAKHGYHKYGGACHVVPNHGLMILSLLYGDDDFQKSLMIVNTSGWDTDCNSGNLGCLLGIKNGLTGIERGPDWRTPLADRLYLPAADGGRAITDAVRESYAVINMGRALAGLPPLSPKDGARFHFEMPGSVQAFRIDAPPPLLTAMKLENAAGGSVQGARSLAIRFDHLAAPHTARIGTATFIPPEAKVMPGSYALLASPTLYSGQVARAGLSADAANSAPVTAVLYISTYGANDQLYRMYGSSSRLESAAHTELRWQIPDTHGQPIAEIGVELRSDQRSAGTLYLDFLRWDGPPQVTLKRAEGTMWKRAWVEGIFRLRDTVNAPFHIVQNEGVGLLMQGTREWTDYRVSATITPHLCAAAGICVRVQGMRRYYALVLHGRGYSVSLIKVLDGTTTLAEVPFAWQFDETYLMRLEAKGDRLRGWIDDQLLFDVQDTGRLLTGGAMALLLEEGCLSSGEVMIEGAAE